MSSSEAASAGGSGDNMDMASTSARKRRKMHPVHDVYSYHETSEESHCVIGACTYKSKGQHAGNLLSHLKTHHKDVYNTVTKQHNESKGERSKQVKKKCSLLNGVQMSGEALQTHCIRLVTEHGLAFQVLDYKAFQDIVQPMIQQMPASERVTISSQAIPPRIHDFANKVRQRMAEEMEGRMISVQVDGCSRNSRAFLGINVTFVKGEKLYTWTLAVEELHGAHTAANLKAVITLILKKYKIPVKNIVAFTTDTGANYVLAGKLLEELEDQEDQLILEGEEDWADADVELLQGDFHIQSVRCAAHTLQLAVDDAFKSSLGTKPTILAARKLVNFLRNPSSVVQLRAAKLPLPTLDVCTRWGSTYDMLRSLIRLKMFIEESFHWTPRDKTAHSLSEDQWGQLQAVMEDLQSVRRATRKLQKERLHLGDFWAIWAEMKMVLAKRDSDLAKAVLEAMETRSQAVQYRERGRGERLSPLLFYPAFCAAVFLDPRYMSLLTADQVAEAKGYLVELWQRLQVARGQTESTPLEPTESGEEDNPEAGSDAEGQSDFERYLAQKNRDRLGGQVDRNGGAAGRDRIRALLDEYDRTQKPSPTDSDVLKFWAGSRLISPELHDLAAVVLAIPATQVSVERLFSALRFILRPQRFGLSAQHVDDVAFLHANRALVEDMVHELPQQPEQPQQIQQLQSGS